MPDWKKRSRELMSEEVPSLLSRLLNNPEFAQEEQEQISPLHGMLFGALQQPSTVGSIIEGMAMGGISKSKVLSNFAKELTKRKLKGPLRQQFMKQSMEDLKITPSEVLDPLEEFAYTPAKRMEALFPSKGGSEVGGAYFRGGLTAQKKRGGWVEESISELSTEQKKAFLEALPKKSPSILIKGERGIVGQQFTSRHETAHSLKAELRRRFPEQEVNKMVYDLENEPWAELLEHPDMYAQEMTRLAPKLKKLPEMERILLRHRAIQKRTIKEVLAQQDYRTKPGYAASLQELKAQLQKTQPK